VQWSHNGWKLHLWDTDSHTKSQLSGLSLEVLLDQLHVHAASLPIYLWEPPNASSTRNLALAKAEASIRRAMPSRSAVRQLATSPQEFQANVERRMKGSFRTGPEEAAVEVTPAAEEWVEVSCGAQQGSKKFAELGK
jgi:hypothetical protein